MKHDGMTEKEPELQATEAPSPGDAAAIAPEREERLFLLLSIFIGIISGLLVVSFRMAIDWLKVLLLGRLPIRDSRDCSSFRRLPVSWSQC